MDAPAPRRHTQKQKPDQAYISRWRRFLRKFIANRVGVIGAYLLLGFALVGILAPQLAPGSPVAMDPSRAFGRPTLAHPFGLDNFGRDVLDRVIWGTRISLGVGLLTVLGSLIFGGFLGLIAGYFKHLDNPIMRFLDGLMAFPGILLAIAIVAVLGGSAFNVVLALTIVSCPREARVIRSSVLTIKQMEYVEAARALGAMDWKILLRHVLPNALPPLIVQASVTFAQAVLSEAGLSFLGLGAPPPTPSWGNILADGRSYLLTAPWISIYPGLAISLTVLALNLVGDAIRDTIDPRLL